MRRSLSVLAVSLAASVRALCAMADNASVSFPAICTKPCDVVVCGGGPAGCAAAIAARSMSRRYGRSSARAAVSSTRRPCQSCGHASIRHDESSQNEDGMFIVSG